MSHYVKRKRRKKRLKPAGVALVAVAIILVALILAGIIVNLLPPNSSPAGNNTSSGTASEPSSSDTSSDIISSTPPEPVPESSSTNVVSYTSSPSYTQSSLGGNYLDVGNQYICEVFYWEAETFDYKSNGFVSKPTLTPLPVGTIDYCSKTLINNGLSPNSSEYKVAATLRCGKRVFTDSLHIERAKVYDAAEYEAINGKIPETNNVTIISGGITSDKRYSTIKLSVDWKAPFSLDVLPQSYASNSDSVRDFSISAVTFSYIDITFCYSSKDVTDDIENIDFTHSIFSRAEWRKNTSDYTLRLYLKKAGGAYGWYAEYDNQGNLVFYFLNPAVITVTNGIPDLTGVNVFLDVGHGGMDSGAIGKLNGTTYYESNMNLKLALAVKEELEAMGATVTLSRDSDVQLRSVDIMQKIRDAKPDIAINIHHDSGGGRGCGVFYYHAFSKKAVDSITDAISDIDLYSRTYQKWHYYYGARVMHCPVVLTENGFMDSAADLELITNEANNQKRAKAIADGIVDYFKELNGIE